MTTFSASIAGFSEKAKRNADLVVRGAAEDVFALATRRQASIKETGTYREGFLPVDDGHLIGSASVEVNGRTAAVGNPAAKMPPDFAMALAGFEGTGTVELVFNADYARHVEYGTGKMPGRFYARNAVLQWNVLVDANADLFR